MSLLRRLLRYFAALRPGKLVLWCYLLWYLTIMARYGRADLRLWLSALGMSGIIGLALYLSTVSADSRPRGWTLFRLFAMPFFVSSYAASIVGQGFLLIFPPSLAANLQAAAVCGAFLLGQRLLRRTCHHIGGGPDGGGGVGEGR